MRARGALLAMGIAVALLPAALGMVPGAVVSRPVLRLDPAPSAAVVLYQHHDCVGPGGMLPPAHAPNPHTEDVPGFYFDPAGREVDYIVRAHPLGGTACLGEDGLPPGFTGDVRLRAVCGDGTLNPGTAELDHTFAFLAGAPLGVGRNGPTSGCAGPPGGYYHLLVTVELRAFSGVPLAGPLPPEAQVVPALGPLDLEVAQVLHG
jgi:hypothetical protein